MDVFSLSAVARLFIVNVAFCSIVLGATALLVSYLLRRWSLPLRYSVLCAAVLLMVASPLPIWFGVSHGLGFVTLRMTTDAKLVQSKPDSLGSAIISTNSSIEKRTEIEAHQNTVKIESKYSKDQLANGVEATSASLGSLDATSVPTRQQLRDFADAKWFYRFVGGFTCIWLVGSLWYFGKLVNGLRMLRRLKREVEITNDPRLTAGVEAAASAMRRKCAIRVCESALAHAPLTLGLWQPVIVVPKDLAKRLGDEELASVLTHEVAHIIRRDTCIAFLQQWTLVVFWWNPFLRFMNQKIAQFRERICDDYSVERIGSGVPLASAMVTIAEWSIGRDRPIPLAATLFDYDGDMEGRVKRLTVRERPIVVSLSPRSMVALGLAAILLGFISIIPIVRAQNESPPVASDRSGSSEWQVQIRTVDAQGNPIANSKIGFQFRGNESPVLQIGGDDGWFVKSFKTQTPSYLYIHARADGYAPMRAFWRNGDEYPIDQLPAEFTFKMMTAIKVGGVVVNEAGEPIEGASVHFSAGVKQDSNASRAQISFSSESYTTDEQGHWTCELAPYAINSGSINVYHPKYVFDASNYSVDDKIDLLRQFKHQWILKKGFAISGRVVDANDEPVEGATLALGELNLSSEKGPFPRTDIDGRYRFEAVSPRGVHTDGPIAFTVMVLKPGFQPVMQSVPGFGKRTMDGSSPQERIVDFKLNRGVPMTLHVVDTLGQPIANVQVHLRSWHDTETLGVLQRSCLQTETDEHGKWHWDDFPRGEQIFFDLFKQGFADVRRREIKVNDLAVTETIALNRPQIIAGTVVDAITKKPIPEFVIQRAFEGVSGNPDGLWWVDRSRSTNGVYRMRVAMPPSKGSYTYRAMAEGYSIAVSKSTPYQEGKTTEINFELMPIVAQVKQPKPDEKSQVIANAAPPKLRRDKFESEVKTTPVSIYGRTISKDGKPIAGVRVWAISSRARQKRLGEAVSNENGEYRIEDVNIPFEVRPHTIERGEFELFGMAEGFAFTWHRADYYPMLVRQDLPTGHSYQSSTGESYVWDEGRRRYREASSENEYSPSIFSEKGFYGDKQINVDLTFSAPSQFSGRLLDDQGQPIVDAKLGLWSVQELRSNVIESTQTMYDDNVAPSELRNRRTDENGFFKYANLPQNCSLMLKVAANGYTTRNVQGFTGSRDDNIFDKTSDIGDGSVLTFKRPINVPIQVVYDDTGLVAKNVSVGLGRADVWDLQTTDQDGLATLKVPPGKYSLDASAEYGTPYLSTEADPSSEDRSHVISADNPTASTLTLRLKRAAEVEVRVVDAVTGKGIAGHDFWIMNGDAKSEYIWRSFEPPNIFRVDRPLTDENGKARLFFVPGRHTIGVEASPSQSIECIAGQVTPVIFTISK